MVKPITFIELVQAAYQVAPKNTAPKVIQKLLATGALKFLRPKEVERLLPQH